MGVSKEQDKWTNSDLEGLWRSVSILPLGRGGGQGLEKAAVCWCEVRDGGEGHGEEPE